MAQKIELRQHKQYCNKKTLEMVHIKKGFLVCVRASLAAQLVKNPPVYGRPWFSSWVGKIHWRREKLPTPVFLSRKFHWLCSPSGHKELDTTEWLSLHHIIYYTADPQISFILELKIYTLSITTPTISPTLPSLATIIPFSVSISSTFVFFFQIPYISDIMQYLSVLFHLFAF